MSTKLVLKEVCKKYAMYDESKANRISSMIGSDAGTLDSLEKTIENNIIINARVCSVYPIKTPIIFINKYNVSHPVTIML